MQKERRREWKMKQSSCSCTVRKSERGVAEREEERVKDEAIIIICTQEKEWKRNCSKGGGEGER